MTEYTPRAFKRLTVLGEELCRSPAKFKPSSLNLGRDNGANMIDSYLPMINQGRMEAMNDMGSHGRKAISERQPSVADHYALHRQFRLAGARCNPIHGLT